MITANDGGPAFPSDQQDAVGRLQRQHFGMSLRDYFAAAALPSVITACVEASGELMQAIPIDAQAQSAYKYADAMLKARES